MGSSDTDLRRLCGTRTAHLGGNSLGQVFEPFAGCGNTSRHKPYVRNVPGWWNSVLFLSVRESSNVDPNGRVFPIIRPPPVE